MDQTAPDFVLPLLYIFIPVILSSFFSYWLGTKIEHSFFRHTANRLLATTAAVLLYVSVFPLCFIFAFSIMQGILSVDGDSSEMMLGVWAMTLAAGKYIVPIFLLIWSTFVVALITRPLMVQYDSEAVVPKRGTFVIITIILVFLFATAALSFIPIFSFFALYIGSILTT